ncbi:YeiH family putative sulfate export transporter [Oscillospiraceae bacterium HV4-5-C5C]|nr:YeiH family putative sulfate export transporter [Oscillospiraceae bacterium HV4-5-C5C]
MKPFKAYLPGLLLSLGLALLAWFAGQTFSIIGGPVFAILLGLLAAPLARKWARPLQAGLKFTSKKLLQYAVILLGFGLNLNVVLETGRRSLPIILSTITTSLVIAYVLGHLLKIDRHTAVLVGVGSSICGGSAIAATAPVIEADDEEIAQSISIIFLFNILAALFFPTLGRLLGFDSSSGAAFGLFAGTAVNDTSSVTATASTWDTMYRLGSATLDTAVTVKLTRTLAIIPITLVLTLYQARQSKKAAAASLAQGQAARSSFSFKKVFPFFILWFIAASLLTTVATAAGVPAAVFSPFKTLSKFFIVMAMAAIGLNTDVIKLVKTGGKPLLLGASCWIGITLVSLLAQKLLGIW